MSEREARVLVDPVERLVAEFVEYLARERGLAVSSITVYEYERTARLFLWRWGCGRARSRGSSSVALIGAPANSSSAANRIVTSESRSPATSETRWWTICCTDVAIARTRTCS